MDKFSKMTRSSILYLGVVLMLMCSCSKKQVDQPAVNNLFDFGKSLALINDENLEESSGLAESFANPNLLWTHNDSGDKARIFLIDYEGKVKATVWLDSAKNRDWEDIAIGPGPEAGKNYLYIADIGDNESEFPYKYIYRIEEPLIDVSKTKDTTIQKVDVIKFQYPDGLRDAESLMIDPLSRDLFVISKRELRANVYRLPYPQITAGEMNAELSIQNLELDPSEIDTVRLNGEVLIRGYHPKYFYQIVAASISNDGTEVLVKSYSTVYYWKRESNETIPALLKRPPTVLPYIPEPQGEAITFSASGDGYFTINEKMRGKEQRLFFYKRKPQP